MTYEQDLAELERLKTSKKRSVENQYHRMKIKEGERMIFEALKALVLNKGNLNE